MLSTQRVSKGKQNNKNSQSANCRTPPVGIPYTKGVSEKLRRTYNKFGVSMYRVPTNTLRAALVRPKDKSDPQQQCGVLYRITCDDCAEQYIGKTGHALSTRVDEHQNRTTAVSEHMKTNNHQFTWDNVEIVGKEEHSLKRKIKEGITIHRTKPNMNRDSSLQPPHIYTHLLSRARPRTRDSVQPS